ncbi:MAG: class I SAM-dependent methyltransferase [Chloroflexi bacterium]|nr:class I SAM-dependent methyltransferase [Chloroflexota bacterium]
MTETPHPSASPTAQPSPDALGLGRTSGQRGAEIIAGFRAEKYPSPETLALSRWAGRIAARIFMRLPQSDKAMNYLVARLYGLTELARRALPDHRENITIVELACGLSPRGLYMAREFPNVQIIEIDLPDVVRDKQQRLQQARSLTLPPNIRWMAADLGVQSLDEILEKQQVDIVVAEGLTPYFSNAEVIRMLQRIKNSLKPGGSLVCDLPWDEGPGGEGQQVAGLFSRQAGLYKCKLKNEAEARQLLADAGYEFIELHRPAQMAETLKLAQPLIEYSFFASARKAPQQAAAPVEAPTDTTPPA